MATRRQGHRLVRAIEEVTDSRTAEHIDALGEVTHLDTNADHTIVRYVTNPGTQIAQVYRIQIWRNHDSSYQISEAERL